MPAREPQGTDCLYPAFVMPENLGPRACAPQPHHSSDHGSGKPGRSVHKYALPAPVMLGHLQQTKAQTDYVTKCGAPEFPSHAFHEFGIPELQQQWSC